MITFCAGSEFPLRYIGRLFHTITWNILSLIEMSMTLLHVIILTRTQKTDCARHIIILLVFLDKSSLYWYFYIKPTKKYENLSFITIRVSENAWARFDVSSCLSKSLKLIVLLLTSYVKIYFWLHAVKVDFITKKTSNCYKL